MEGNNASSNALEPALVMAQVVQVASPMETEHLNPNLVDGVDEGVFGIHMVIGLWLVGKDGANLARIRNRSKWIRLRI